MAAAGTIRIAPLALAPRSRIPAALRLPVPAQLALGASLALAYVVLLSLDAPGAAPVAFAMLGVALLAPPAGLAAIALVLALPEPELLSPPGIIALLVGVTGVGILARVPFGRPSIRVSPGILFLAGYMLLATVSLLPAVTGYPADEAASATLEFIHLASGVGVFLVAVYLFRTVPGWPIVAITVGVAVVAALVAIADFFAIGPVLELVSGLRPPSEEARAAGLFSNSNYFGFFSAQVLTLLVAMIPVTRRWGRMLTVLATIAVAVALALSLSRGAYVGAAVGVFVLIALRRPRMALALLGAAIIAVLVLYPVFLALRIEVSAGSTDPKAYLDLQRSEHWRQQAFGAGIEMFLSSPVFGLGFGMFQFLSPEFIGFSPATYSHNQWLDLLAEQGLVGVGFMLATLASLGVALRRSTHPYAAAAIAMVVAYAVESLFINSLTSIQASGPIFIVLALVLARRPDETLRGRRT